MINKKPFDSSVPHSKVDMIYYDLGGRILRIEYEPGEILNETALASEFKVSRTPLREALRRLQQEGWLVMLPNIGMQVAQINLSEIKGLYSTKEVLEKFALYEAMEHATPDGINKMKGCLSAVQKANPSETDTLTTLDTQFHFTLGEISDNEVLSRYLYDLQERIYRLWYYSLKHGATINKEELYSSLYQLEQCIEKKDKEYVNAAVTRYIKFHKGNLVNGLF